MNRMWEHTIHYKLNLIHLYEDEWIRENIIVTLKSSHTFFNPVFYKSVFSNKYNPPIFSCLTETLIELINSDVLSVIQMLNNLAR